MHPRNHRKYLGLMFLTVAWTGCDPERSSDGDPGGGLSGRLWSCEETESQVICSAAIAAQPGESDAYACDAEDKRSICPPAGTLPANLVSDENVSEAPWACLVTGEHQRECIKGLRALDERPTQVPDDCAAGSTCQAPDGNEADPTPTGEDPDPSTDPVPPTECIPDLWEPYFCALATNSYRSNGVDITFPCEIFDANALAPVEEILPLNLGMPSCASGESAMRRDSWLDSVDQGCTQLSGAILVMCQQGANYAPRVGACMPTGSW